MYELASHRPFLSVGLLALAVATACTSDEASQMSPSGSGGSSGRGGSAGTPVDGGGTSGEGGMRGNVTLVPSDDGWIDRMDEGNSVGVQGAWYPYGDQYGVAKCTTVGGHEPDECSTIFSPDPLVTGFPNDGGKMCTRGETAVVLPCLFDVPNCPPGTPDYSNMWGAGIGLDLNADGATDAGSGEKHAYNPDEHGVVGIAFDIDTVPLPKLRVEFPIELPDGTTTEDHLDGSPYWGATSDYPPSNVVVGHNELRWDEVAAPRTNYTFERTKILSIQFHVPAITSGTTRGEYEFCISNLTFLRE